MKQLIPLFAFSTFTIMSCIDQTPTPPNSNTLTASSTISAAACPTSALQVFKVSYNEAQGKYTIFHNAGSESKNLPNPLSVKNLQMAQIPNAKDANTEIAKLNFSKTDGNCTPVLEMTQGYKIDLVAATTSSTENGQTATGSSSSSSSWAPFLMGALVGNAVSNAMQPRYAPPAYYLPPPASPQGGVVTGGVSGKTPDELNKKYESQYKQSPTKKGFFSSRASTPSDDNTPKKKGFFSGGSNTSSTKKSGSFFKKKK